MREPAIDWSERSDQPWRVTLRLDRLSLLFFAALALSLTAWLAAGWALPLWFDETYTGTIASQPDVAGLVRSCLAEITGPAFYMPMWLWAKLAGTSDTALRLPSLLFAVGAPAIIAWRGHPDRAVRLFWAIFSLLWLPLLPMATEARSYPQLLLLGSLQAIFFLRLSKSAGRGEAFAWTTVTALFVLTNYYALVVSGFQALALGLSLRRKLLRLYPALLPFVPAAAWMAFHLPVVLRFASEHGTMFQHLPPGAVLAIPLFLFGAGLHAYLIAALLAFTHSSWWSGAKRPSPEAQLVWTGIAAFALIFAIGLFRATMAPRYVTVVMPPLLFGLACWARRLRTRRPAAVGAMLAIFFVTMGATLAVGPGDPRFDDRRNLQFETASDWLMQRPVARLYYLKPAPSPTPRLDAEVAGFFFARAERPVQVIPETYAQAMTVSLAGDPRAGVLLITDRRSPHEFEAWIAGTSAAWECRSFGQNDFGVAACRRRTEGR